MQRIYLIFFCTLGAMGNTLADKGIQLQYPLYRGVDCTLNGGHPTGQEDLGYYDEYCSHLVCEGSGLCKSHGGAYVYDLPLWDYRGAQIIANSPGGSTALLRRDGSFISWGRGAYPYHNTFYDILDDPVWSKGYPDLEYIHYFGTLPKRRQ